MPRELDYEAQVSSPRRVTPVRVACAIVVGVVLVLNLSLLVLVATDTPNGSMGGWTDVIVGAWIAPWANGFLMLIALACTWIVRRKSRGGRVTPYVLTAFLVPIAAYAFDFAIISNGLLR